MSDKEKVLKGLECLITNEVPCEGCPYDEDKHFSCLKSIAKDALELLKEQEPKPPRIFQTVDKIFYACDNCGKSLFVIVDSGTLNASSVFPKFCSECGRAVKW